MKQLFLFISLLLTLPSFGQNETEDKEQLLEKYYKQYEEMMFSMQGCTINLTQEILEEANLKVYDLEEKIIALETSLKIEVLYKEYELILDTITTSYYDNQWKERLYIKALNIEDSIILLEQLYYKNNTSY